MKAVKIIVGIALIVGLSSAVYAAETARIASVLQTKGTVEVKMGGDIWMPARDGMILKQGDAIRAKQGSFALLNLDGNGQTATVEVKENSSLALASLIEDKAAGTEKTLLDLSLGGIMIKAKKLHSEKSSFEVKTPTSIVGVRGTTFAVTVEAMEE